MGQGLVEFALVAPVFLLVIFSMVNAGFLLYSVNAVAQSATIGSNSIAASGNVSNADILGVQRMVAAGLGTTALVSVKEIDIEELANDPQGGFQVAGDGSPVIQTGCSGAGGSFSSNQCVDRYTFSGSAANPTVTALDGTCSSQVNVSQCPPWTPESRVVTNGNDPQGNGCSYLAMKITYRYDFKGAPAGFLQLTTLKTFRLEPQS